MYEGFADRRSASQRKINFSRRFGDLKLKSNFASQSTFIEMNFSLSRDYALKVWLTAAIGGPAVISLDFLWTRYKLNGFDTFWNDLTSFWGIFFLSLVIGVLLSVPSFFLLWVLVALVSLTELQIWAGKILILIVSTILTVLPFYFLFEGDIWRRNILTFILPYWLGVWAGIIIYPFSPPDSRLHDNHTEQTLRLS